MSETTKMALEALTYDVIVWAREVEVRGLPVHLQKELENFGAFWATRGMRMPDYVFEKFTEMHPELVFQRHELQKPEECEHHQHQD
ncbi:MAG: hypothetical protein K1Y36_28740 [Blastocatellia bacterium]|nr:hypothetical protein [Blastocatellia bacterium]